MPTPEHLRWVSSELTIELLEHYASGPGVVVVEKQLARWFPDASPAEQVALRRLAGEHLHHYAILMRDRADKMIANGRMVEGRCPGG